MAQTELITPSSVETGDPGYWEPAGHGSEQPSDMWRELAARLASPAHAAMADPSDGLDMARVLDAWRSAERQLAELPEADPTRAQVRTQIHELRAKYQSLFALKR